MLEDAGMSSICPVIPTLLSIYELDFISMGFLVQSSYLIEQFPDANLKKSRIRRRKKKFS